MAVWTLVPGLLNLDIVSLAMMGDFALKSILLLLVVFLGLLVHELGHFLAARLCGIAVKRVAIGIGKTLIERTDRHGTLWTLGVFPFGANADLGMDTESGFYARPYWKRAFVIAAGPLANLVLPFLLFPAFYVIAGQPSGPPVIVGIEKGQVADRAGLQPGDRILEVNGVPVLNFKDIWREGYEKGAVEGVYTIRRGEREFEIALKPDWSEYIDGEGIARANARLGVLWGHGSVPLRDILSVNGRNTDKNPALARRLIVENFDRPALVGIRGIGDKPALFRVMLDSKANPYMDRKRHRDYKRVFLGSIRGNFYLRQGFSAQIQDGIRYAREKLAKIALIPTQIFPIDSDAVTDPDWSGNPDTAVANYAYRGVHGLAVFSIILAFINLLPLPHLDGGHILVQGIEAARKKPMTRKAKAKLFVAAFLTFYLSMLLANTDSLPRYIDLKLKKVHEFMDGDRRKP